MSFFQGMAQAFKDADDQRFRMKVLGEEQGFIRERDAASQAHDREMRMMEINARRQEALLQATAGRNSRGGGGSGSSSAANPATILALAGYIGEAEGRDDFLADANLNPETADQLVKNIEAANERRAQGGLPPLTGEEILQASRIYGVDIPGDALSMEDILAADLSDPDVFEEMATRAAQSDGGRQTTSTFTPPAMPSTTIYNQQFEAVKSNIVNILSRELSQLSGEESPEASIRQTQLQGLMNGIEDGDEVAVNQALSEYGPAVVDMLKQQGSPIMNGVEQNPFLAGVFAQTQQEAPTAPVAPSATTLPETTQTPPEAAPTQPESQPQETGERTPIQQDFNSMEEAQAFLQTLPPGRYLIMVDGQEYPARVE